MKKAELKTEEMDIDFLIENYAEYNPRKITEGQLTGLNASIEQFGYVQNIIFNKTTNTIVSGHQRLSVLKHQGYEKVDVLVVEMDIEKEKQLNILMNSQQISGDFTSDVLSLLEEIEQFNPELYDLTNMKEIEMLLEPEEKIKDIEDEEDDDTDPDLERQMETLPYEHFDCILVVFENVDDFTYISSRLGLQEKTTISAPNVGNKKIGKTRAIKASKLIEMMDKEKGM